MYKNRYEYKYELEIGGNIVQFGNERKDITLIKDRSLMYKTPYHFCELVTCDEDGNINKEVLNEDITLEDCYDHGFVNKFGDNTIEKYDYFDGKRENKLLISGGLAGTELRIELGLER